eukprot:13179100-Alexandrium_andersonii.AAC.1
MLLLPRTSTLWQDVAGASTDTYETVEQLVFESMCDAWRRLVFCFQCLPWSLFHVTDARLSDSDVTEWLNHNIPTCSRCVDEAFSRQIVAELQSESQPVRRAVRDFLSDIASRVRVSSLSCEREHLIKTTKKDTGRGKRLPVNEAIVSYIASIKSEHAKNKALVDQDLFGKSGKASATRLIANKSFATGEMDQRKRRKLSGWQMFVQARGTNSMSGAMPELSKRWAELAACEREVYERKAAAETARLDRNIRAIGDQVLSSPMPDGLTKSVRSRLLHQKLQNTIDQVDKHPSWRRGLGMASHSSPLKPELVDGELRSRALKQASKLLFGYDESVVENGPSQQRELVCWMKFGGTCKTCAFHSK